MDLDESLHSLWDLIELMLAEVGVPCEKPDASWERLPESKLRELVQGIREMRRKGEGGVVTSEAARQRIATETGQDVTKLTHQSRKKLKGMVLKTKVEVIDDPSKLGAALVLASPLMLCDPRLVDRVEPCQLCLQPVGLGRETPTGHPVVCGPCFIGIDPEAS